MASETNDVIVAIEHRSWFGRFAYLAVWVQVTWIAIGLSQEVFEPTKSLGTRIGVAALAIIFLRIAWIFSVGLRKFAVQSRIELDREFIKRHFFEWKGMDFQFPLEKISMIDVP